MEAIIFIILDEQLQHLQKPKASERVVRWKNYTPLFSSMLQQEPYTVSQVDVGYSWALN